MNAEAEMTAAVIGVLYSVKGWQFFDGRTGIKIKYGGSEDFFEGDAILIDRKVGVWVLIRLL